MKAQNKSLRRTPDLVKKSKWLVAIPLFALLIKVFLIFRIESGIWYGADAESYLEGGDGFLFDGFYSDNVKLSYLPAGYSYFLFLFAKINLSYFSYAVSIFQSVVFALATYLLSRLIAQLGYRTFAIAVSLLISINLTLSLSSLVIGYENIVASLIAIAVVLLINASRSKSSKVRIYSVGVSMLSISLASAMQPRYLLLGIGILIVYLFFIKDNKTRVVLLVLGLMASLVFPSIFAFRNNEVIKHPVISYNLGYTMKIGAGDETKGGFNRTGKDLQCGAPSTDPVLADQQAVSCVISWYLSNPLQAIRLSYNKSIYYWSPWFGVLAEGTMARNPWVSISPVIKMAANPETRSLVMGNLGKTISYIWIFSQLVMVFFGYRELRKRGSFEKLLANLAGVSILLSWITSLATIGDHRFRIPTMFLSLMLQAIALDSLRHRFSKVV